MKNHFSLLLIILLGGLLCLPGTAIAQNEVVINRAVVNLWPEFSLPSVLVTYEIELAPETDLPHEIILQIPMGAQIQVVASQDVQGELTNLETDITPIGRWQDIQFAAPTHSLRLEYQDPTIVKQEDLRIFDFDWLSIYSVEQFSIFVQQPFGASELIIEPTLTRIENDNLDQTFYVGEIGAVGSGELFSLNLRYTKDPENVTYPALRVSAAMPINDSTRGRTASPLSVVIWLVAVAVAVVIFVGLLYWWARSNLLDKPDQVVQGLGIMNPEKQVVFCHECGMRSRGGDSYCRNCGTELRRFT